LSRGQSLAIDRRVRHPCLGVALRAPPCRTCDGADCWGLLTGVCWRRPRYCKARRADAPRRRGLSAASGGEALGRGGKGVLARRSERGRHLCRIASRARGGLISAVATIVTLVACLVVRSLSSVVAGLAGGNRVHDRVANDTDWRADSLSFCLTLLSQGEPSWDRFMPVRGRIPVSLTRAHPAAGRAVDAEDGVSKQRCGVSLT
jgi:hypothetical protein